MSNKQWYKDGLCFSCTQCGNCCSGQPGYVWINSEEIAKVVEYLKKKGLYCGEPFVRRVGVRYSLIEKEDGDCIFLERKEGKALCMIHAVKPTQCKTWPFWDSILSDKNIWDECAEECPGMDTGKLYSIKEIKEIMELEQE